MKGDLTITTGAVRVTLPLCLLVGACSAVAGRYAHPAVAAGTVIVSALLASVVMRSLCKALIARPLMRLSNASLLDEKELQTEPRFREVKALKMAFGSMRGEIEGYNSFAPDMVRAYESEADRENPLCHRLPPEGVVAIVFTDIESSSQLWQTCPSAMHAALQMHHDTIRRCYAQHNGYEVKTIGDAFMLAFDTGVAACAFCLEAQSALVDEDWPLELLGHEICEKVLDSEDRVIYRGLRVRMGVHRGNVTMEPDRITGRADYFGPNVNKAARVEAAVVGGTVAVTDVVVDELHGSALPFCQLELGIIDLKGIGPTRLHAIIPPTLRGRRPHTCLTTRRKATLPQVPSTTSDDGEPPSPLPTSSTLNLESPRPSPAVANTRANRNSIGSCLSYNARSRAGSLRAPDMASSTHATVAQIRLTQTFRSAAVETLKTEAVTLVLQGIEYTSDSTGGRIVAFAGDMATVLWRCSSHIIQSMRFASFLDEGAHITSPNFTTKTWMGISSGPLHLGACDTGQHRYPLVVGIPVSLSAALAEEAELLGAAALIPSSLAARSPALASFTRPVDRWQLLDEGETVMDVLQVRVQSLAEVDKWGMMYGMAAVDEQWNGSAYIDAFDKAFSSPPNTAPLQRLATSHPSDSVLQKVVALALGRRVRSGIYFPPAPPEPTHLVSPPIAGEVSESSWNSRLTHSVRHHSVSLFGQRPFTMEEVEESGGLVVVDGWVHDVTTFINSHPGGADVLRRQSGRDVTHLFKGEGGHVHSASAYGVLTTLRVGRLIPNPTRASSSRISAVSLRESWKAIEKYGVAKAGGEVFRSFFATLPSALPLFSPERIGTVSTSFMTILGHAIYDPDTLLPRLRLVALVHARHSIPSGAYDALGAALLETVGRISGGSAMMQRAWEELYAGVVAALRGCKATPLSEPLGVFVDDPTLPSFSPTPSLSRASSPLEVRALDPSRFLAAQVVQCTPIACTVTKYVLVVPSCTAVQAFPPGALVVLRRTGSATPVEMFSPTLVDTSSGSLEVHVISRSRQGCLLASVHEGDTVDIRGPVRCGYVFQPHIHIDSLCFVVAGTAVSLCLSIAREEVRRGCRIYILLANRTASDVALHDELIGLGTNVSIRHCLNHETEVPPFLEGPTADVVVGRDLDAVECFAFFPQPAPGVQSVVCGPDSFTSSVGMLMKKMGYSTVVVGLAQAAMLDGM
eukprot:Sspe_Gene.9355::Locus_3143_Transcript_5_5_Confidence_0.429_Length_4671::g.9355::m.9355